MKIYLGADHNGYKHKEQLELYLQAAGHDVVDLGGQTLQPSDDFPDYAAKVAQEVLSDAGHDARGVLLCGSGQGMCMAANRFKGIRASLCWNQGQARAARNDDDSNVLCLPSRELSNQEVQSITSIWLRTPFANADRYVRRLKQLDRLP